MSDLAPETREEAYLSALASDGTVNLEPKTRKEAILQCAINGTLPSFEPETREEAYLVEVCKKIAGGGSGGGLDVEQIDEIVEALFANGDMVVTAPDGKLYKNVTINKPDTLVPENIAKDVNIAGVVGNHTCPEPVLQDKTFTENGTYSADAGFTGLGTVVVDVASSGGEGVDYLEQMLNGTLSEYSSGDVEKIPTNAFYQCYALTNASFPACTTIGDYAFYECIALTNVSFPACTSIGFSAFDACGSLISATFPECTAIGTNAFRMCRSLTNINFPACTNINGSAFSSCSALTTVNFPACTTIGNNAFYQCSALTTVNFPACTSIAGSAFYQCSALTTVNFPACTSIAGSAFYRCYALTNVSFPACTSIGYAAFYQCTALTNASFPACTTIRDYAFYQCSALTTLILEASSVCALAGSNAFARTPIASGTGRIYVPASLVGAYKSETNWTYYSTQIFAIEDMPS